MRCGFRAASAAIFVLAHGSSAAAQEIVPASVDAASVADLNDAQNEDIFVTGSRTHLPITALPLTADVIDKESLDQQVATSGSIIDAVSAVSSSFSPTREGSRDGYTIDPFFIDLVELIYGSNALQGTLGISKDS